MGGFNTEYSSIRFALFYLAEFMNTITMSAIMVTLFFGGPAGPDPFVGTGHVVMPVIWFLLKVVIFCFVFVWLRGALPRFRYDQLMDLGWKLLIPASLAWMLLVAGFLISAWWGVGIAAAVIVGAVAAVARLRARCRARAQRRRRARRSARPVPAEAAPSVDRRPEATDGGLMSDRSRALNFFGGFTLTAST